MTAIFQFGTSRFLQAHVAFFAWQARQAGQEVPPIIVVQTTMDPQRARRVAAFNDPAGYPVIIRGLAADRTPIEQAHQVGSVTIGLAAATQWEEVKDRFAQEASWVISNTGDSGYQVSESGEGFPAMLLALLHHRWRSGGGPVTMLPCELVRQNGALLKGIVADLAQGLEPGFLAWLTRDCIWANTLVDRIVSEPIEPVGAVAEPYALWAVEWQPELAMPFTHPDVVLTGDLTPYDRLKVHILNLGHSWMAQHWLDTGQPEGGCVGDMVGDPALLFALEDLYAREVVPGFAVHGLETEARAYVEATLARFANPFLHHRLSDIATGHAAKLEKRVADFIDWVAACDPSLAMPRLRDLAVGNDGFQQSRTFSA